MKNIFAIILICVFSPFFLIYTIQNIYDLRWIHKDEMALSYVLHRECPRDIHIEAMKALAVILRSNLHSYFLDEWVDLLKSSSGIVYETEFQDRKDDYYKVIEDTDELILAYDGKIQRGRYHEISSSRTRDGSMTNVEYFGFLDSVLSTWDQDADGFLQVFSFSDMYLKRRFSALKSDSEITIVEKDIGGYVNSIKLGNTYFTGDYIRESLSLSSSCFTVEKQDDHWIFTCRGVGHGLGLSLYGADYLAKKGKDYKYILKYYFPQFEIMKE